MAEKNKEFLVLAMVSVVIVVALFVAAPTTSGRVVRGATSPTQSSTDTTWVCTWDNGWKWTATYADGTRIVIPNIIGPENSNVNCDDAFWYCTSGNRCDASTESQTCECGKQLSISRLGSSN